MLIASKSPAKLTTVFLCCNAQCIDGLYQELSAFINLTEMFFSLGALGFKKSDDTTGT